MKKIIEIGSVVIIGIFLFNQLCYAEYPNMMERSNRKYMPQLYDSDVQPIPMPLPIEGPLPGIKPPLDPGDIEITPWQPPDESGPQPIQPPMLIPGIKPPLDPGDIEITPWQPPDESGPQPIPMPIMGPEGPIGEGPILDIDPSWIIDIKEGPANLDSVLYQLYLQTQIKGDPIAWAKQHGLEVSRGRVTISLWLESGVEPEDLQLPPGAELGSRYWDEEHNRWAVSVTLQVDDVLEVATQEGVDIITVSEPGGTEMNPMIWLFEFSASELREEDSEDRDNFYFMLAMFHPESIRVVVELEEGAELEIPYELRSYIKIETQHGNLVQLLVDPKFILFLSEMEGIRYVRRPHYSHPDFGDGS